MSITIIEITFFDMVSLEVYMFSRIGMALVSAQRVEFITKELVKYLAEFDTQIYGIVTPDFLDSTQKGVKSRIMLGEIFRLLKLNPKFVIEEKLDDYLKMRNELVHSLWHNYLFNNS